MRALHVISSVYDSAAGTAYAVDRMCSTLGLRGVTTHLHTLAPEPGYVPEAYDRIGYPAWISLGKLGVSSAMRLGVLNAAQHADVIHNHGLWMCPNLYASQAAEAAKRPVMHSVHGMLASASLQRSRWKKKAFLRLGQQSALDAVTCFHVTSASEYGDVRRLGFTQPILLLPFGIDVPAICDRQVADDGRRRLLFLGRVDPIKRVDVLVSVWRRLQDDLPEWDLQICGPDSGGHLSEVKAMAANIGAQRVDFLGPRYGEAKNEVLRRCDLLVLPSKTENFGFSVAEALAHGRPAIASRTTPWGVLESEQCGWWIGLEPSALEVALRDAMSSDRLNLAAMGNRGRVWIERALSWGRVGQVLDGTYRWLTKSGSVPAEVSFV